MHATTDILFEIGTEELPPKSLFRLISALKHAFEKGLAEQKLTFDRIDSFATPRRLAVLIKNCLKQQPDYLNQRKGPALKAAFDAEGNPSKAALGFAQSCGVAVEALKQISGDQGVRLFFEETIQGQSAFELLPEIANMALDSLPIAKRMRWGDLSDAFIRPVHWILFIDTDQLIPFTRFGINSDRTTQGHPYHHPASIEIPSPIEYQRLLKEEGHVLADYQQRKDLIQQSLISIAQKQELTVDLDEDLLDEVTSITEWPVAQVCHFEDTFLALPAEILVMSMKDHQKYFPFYTTPNQLSNTFVTFSNIKSSGDEIIKGNERVVRPRLSDAQFFWTQDLSEDLRSRYTLLKDVIFHKDLGSYFDKTERLKALAHLLSAHFPVNLELLDQAAEMSRCDLLSKTVYEFPDLQGTVGKYLANTQGAAPEIIAALDEFYLPRFAGDRLPQSDLGKLLSLSDRVDSLVGILLSGHKPSGDKDPFGLRRLAIGVIRILRELDQPIFLTRLLQNSASCFSQFEQNNEEILTYIYEFILSRAKFLALEEGYSFSIVDGVLQTKPQDIADAFIRFQAIQDFLKTEDASPLIALNKRISNILNKSSVEKHEYCHSLLSDITELNLAKALEEISAAIQQTNLDKNYTQTLRLLFQLETAIANFFDHVMVNCEDQKVRENRHHLLYAVHDLFLGVCDFSLLAPN